MTRTMVLIGFAVALAAGVVLGLALARAEPRRAGERSRGPGGWLTAELGLSAEQRKQLDAIWSASARDGSRDHWTRRRQLRQQRDEAIAALIPETSKADHDRIRADYDRQVAELEAEWKQNFQSAVERTRKILTDKQREKYDQIMSRHNAERQQRGDGDRRGPGYGPPSGSRPMPSPPAASPEDSSSPGPLTPERETP